MRRGIGAVTSTSSHHAETARWIVALVSFVNSCRLLSTARSLVALSSNSINDYGHISYRANVSHPLAARAKIGLRIHQPRGTLRL